MMSSLLSILVVARFLVLNCVMISFSRGRALILSTVWQGK